MRSAKKKAQNFVRSVVTAVQASQEWSTTAIVLAYDDTDGWYDQT